MATIASLPVLGPQPHARLPANQQGVENIPTVDPQFLGSTNLYRAIKLSGRNVGERALWVMKNLGKTLPAGYSSPTFKMVSVSDLGFPDGAYLEEIHNVAHACNLLVCSHYDAGVLAACYQQQPEGELVTVATEKLIGKEGDSLSLQIFHGTTGRWFGAHRRPADEFWLPESLFAFRCT